MTDDLYHRHLFHQHTIVLVSEKSDGDHHGGVCQPI